MKITISSRQLPNVEKVKAKAFCLKVSCDSMVDVPKEWKKKVDKAEDYAEDVFEKLTDATSQTAVDKLLNGGTLITSPKDIDKIVNEILSMLESLAKESRRAIELPTEILYVELLKEGLFGGKKKDKEK